MVSPSPLVDPSNVLVLGPVDETSANMSKPAQDAKYFTQKKRQEKGYNFQ